MKENKEIQKDLKKLEKEALKNAGDIAGPTIVKKYRELFAKIQKSHGREAKRREEEAERQMTTMSFCDYFPGGEIAEQLYRKSEKPSILFALYIPPEKRKRAKGEKILYVTEIAVDEIYNILYVINAEGKKVYVSEEKGKLERIIIPEQDEKSYRKGVVLFATEAKEYGNTKKLLHKVERYIIKAYSTDEKERMFGMYYALLTWAYRAFYSIPFLRFIGEFGSGKSTYQDYIGWVSYKPITIGSTSPSSFFRMADRYHGTMLLDEADFRNNDSSREMLTFLNNSFRRGKPTMRTEKFGNRLVSVPYDTYCPVILVTRGRWSDNALESRTLSLFLKKGRRKVRHTDPTPDLIVEAQEIRNMFLMWLFDNHRKIEVEYDLVDPSISDRLNQTMISIKSIIYHAEVEELKEGKEKITKKLKESLENISKIKTFFKENKNVPYTERTKLYAKLGKYQDMILTHSPLGKDLKDFLREYDETTKAELETHVRTKIAQIIVNMCDCDDGLLRWKNISPIPTKERWVYLITTKEIVEKFNEIYTNEGPRGKPLKSVTAGYETAKLGLFKKRFRDGVKVFITKQDLELLAKSYPIVRIDKEKQSSTRV